VYKGCFFPTSLPTPVVSGVFDDGYSKRGEVESYCGFDLHFLYSFSQLLIGLLALLVFNFLSSLYILYSNLPLDECLTKISLPYCGIFSLVIVSVTVQKLLN
jgi:hypothetical protein